MDKQTAGLRALERLFQIALRDTGQSRRVANFLLAWHNAEENGGWDPVDLWNVDDAIARRHAVRARVDPGAPCLCRGTRLSLTDASGLGTVARGAGLKRWPYCSGRINGEYF